MWVISQGGPLGYARTWHHFGPFSTEITTNWVPIGDCWSYFVVIEFGIQDGIFVFISSLFTKCIHSLFGLSVWSAGWIVTVSNLIFSLISRSSSTSTFAVTILKMKPISLLFSSNLQRMSSRICSWRLLLICRLGTFLASQLTIHTPCTHLVTFGFCWRSHSSKTTLNSSGWAQKSYYLSTLLMYT